MNKSKQVDSHTQTMKTETAEKLMSICAPNAPLENNHILDNIFGIDNLTEEQRIQVEAELIKHFDFERIVWMKLPTGLTEDETKAIVVKTYKITNSDPKHTGKVGYVYKVLFTPKMYDPKELHEPVKDGCVFAPTMYNPKTFEPKQSITLTWSPDFPQDIDAHERTYEDDKQMIRDMLEKVLDNPEEYRPEGFRGCIVRFATDSDTDGIEKLFVEMSAQQVYDKYIKLLTLKSDYKLPETGAILFYAKKHSEGYDIDKITITSLDEDYCISLIESVMESEEFAGWPFVREI